jgi:hypothetical protein
LQSDLHIANNVDGGRENLGEDPAHDGRQLWTGSTGSTNARVHHLLGRNPRSCASLMHRPVERFPRLRFANPHDIAGTAGGGSDQAILVPDRARGLGSSAVNAEIMGHGLFLAQKSSQFSAAGSH